MSAVFFLSGASFVTAVLKTAEEPRWAFLFVVSALAVIIGSLVEHDSK